MASFMDQVNAAIKANQPATKRVLSTGNIILPTSTGAKSMAPGALLPRVPAGPSTTDQLIASQGSAIDATAAALEAQTSPIIYKKVHWYNRFWGWIRHKPASAG